MGSLMSGWSSTVLGDDKRVRLMRNRSLTKEEVDAFWRQRGRPGPDNTQGSPLGSPRNSELLQQQESTFEARQLDGRMIRSLPSPLARGRHHFSPRSEPSSQAPPRTEGFHENAAAATITPSTSCHWWTRSNWAFLNEPPHKQEESSMSGRGKAHKAHASDQFIVARIVTGNA